MELDNRNQQVDRWLDAAIKQYGTVEPHPDLEQDVLRRLRSAPERSKLRLGWLVFAAAMIALLAAGVVISNRHQDVRQVAAEKVVTPALDEKKVAEDLRISEHPHAASSRIRQRKARRPATEVRTHSWPAQFPSPQPLSEQERMFVSYAERFPTEAMLTQQEHEQFEEVVKHAQEADKNAASASNQER